MKSKKTMLLVIDPSGRIVAAAHRDAENSSEMSTGLVPLAGQEVCEVEVPEEITRLRSGHDFHLALAHAKFDRATRKVAFPKITFKKLKH